jgi:hypothetical protein
MFVIHFKTSARYLALRSMTNAAADRPLSQKHSLHTEKSEAGHVHKVVQTEQDAY